MKTNAARRLDALGYPVYLDEAAFAHERISVSAGVRGVQILLAPADFERATGSRRARFARERV